MRYTPALWHIILLFAPLVTLIQGAEWLCQVWDERLVPQRL
jgi:hypothetical protein